MFHVDILSGYLICGASALVSAGLLRLAEATDPRTQRTLRDSGWGFLMLGCALTPAGLAGLAGHPLVQLSLGLGAVAALLLLARGLGQVCDRVLPWSVVLGGTLVAAPVMVLAIRHDLRLFGTLFAACLAGVSIAMAWQTRDLVTRPAHAVDRALGLMMLTMVLTSVPRLGATMLYDGPPRTDLMYLPEPWNSVYVVLYSLMPMTVATLLVSLVNARLRAQLQQRASTDELTGTLTRHALRDRAPPLLAERGAGQHEAAVLMLDLDHFKAINDRHGHATGDAVLRLAADVLQAHLRPDALLARYGGEEFVVVLPVDDLPAARRIAERLRGAIEATDWPGRLALDRGLTVSVGVAMVAAGEGLDAAMQRADAALYRAKHEGRNRCQVGLVAA